MTRILRCIAALLLLLYCSTPASAGIRKGPYLLFEGSSTAMTVLWQTDASETNTIRWGTDTSYSMGQASVGTYGTDFQHKQVISGLEPGTLYYYEVVGYGAGSFRTAPPASATAVKLIAYGDTRTYPADHDGVAGKIRAAYAADPAFQTIALHAGDWVASNGETYWTNEWFVSGTTYPQLKALQAEVPIVGVRGNHEGTGTIYAKYFPEPYVAGFYWSFDYGPVHVAMVDQYTTYTAGSPQLNWLASDLAATTKPWKIVVLHEPGWTSGGSHGNNTTVQTVLQPLFKQYGVQLVIGGHNHYYARGVVENIQHLTLGGGGAPLYAPASGQSGIVKTDQSNHHTELDIDGNTMLFTARRADGTVIESLTIPSGINQAPIANAGVDQTVTDIDGNGTENVILNGTASSDPDGTISNYAWKEGAVQIATGALPTVSLAVGVHTITLTVTDNLGATATDTVQITVTAPPCNATNTNIPGSCYQTIGTAYQAANDGDTIKTVALDFAESVAANRPISATILGGYDSEFSAPTGVSGITSLIIQNGMVTVSNFAIAQ
jgi:predicted phosphodiesterase